MYLCLDCYEVFDGKYLNNDCFSDYQICPKTNCHGSLIEVDELMLPVIIELNKKGFYTRYCCSGHFYTDHPQAYIMFDDLVELPSLPNGFKKDEDSNTIRSIGEIRTPTYSDCYVIYKNATNLLKWARKLTTKY